MDGRHGKSISEAAARSPYGKFMPLHMRLANWHITNAHAPCNWKPRIAHGNGAGARHDHRTAGALPMRTARSVSECGLAVSPPRT
jgi:hypothetical protein